ncbi:MULTISPECIES: hypothetical protein [unclassified Enterococcus]|uniref:hypothetical protein n=1 Tax=unclassified Enterococcus TaxID=2608891 RepID=UPI000B7276EA|nr:MULTISPECIES: hypothetical protein [unclassified Enterococcus]OTO65530.1 hypothetical protein A5865_003594 [Enterococcus sp. 12E11_DIV0728]OUZ13396.1 hypothetical protein A5868_003599 [Enterococcus sp. 12F9_DIV0723]
MIVIGIIERLEVDWVPFLFAAAGVLTIVVSLQGYTGGLGYRGIAFLIYGKRIWQFSNRLFGILFVVLGILLYLSFQFFAISADQKVLAATIACLVCAALCDVTTVILKRHRSD